MTTPLRATDEYATFQGREYAAGVGQDGWVALRSIDWYPPPAGDAVESLPRTEVHLDELDAYDEVRVLCTWRDHAFEIVKINDDLAWCDFVDPDRRFTWVGAGRLQQIERGFWAAELPIVELEDVTEQRTALLPRLRDSHR